MSSLIAALADSIEAKLLPDNATHQYRMEIKSSSSNRLYTVAKNKSNGEWGCSCPGWIIKRGKGPRTCKHLKAIMSALQALDKAGGRTRLTR